MLKIKNPLSVVSLKYGIAGIVLSILAIIVMYYLVSHPLSIIVVNPLMDIRIPLYLLLVFAALKEFKDYYGGGYLHFWQAMIIGVGVYMITSLGTAIFIFIISKVEVSGFLTGYIEQSKAYLILNKEEYFVQLGEDRFNQAVNGLDEVSALSLTSQYLLQSTFIGLFLTFILSIIMRKKNH